MNSHKATEAKSTEQRGANAVTAAPQPLALGQRLGNQGLGHLLRSRQLQAKLTVSNPTDVYEQEADRVADQVMRMDAPVSVQRKCQSCEEELHRFSESSAVPSVDAATEQSISSLSARGSPLSNSVRAFMEPRFNADFSAVRIHNDAHAHGLARSVNAQAFTVGRNVVFGAGHYAPETDNGKRLLAHELTHVVQQTGSGAVTIARKPHDWDPGDFAEAMKKLSNAQVDAEELEIALGGRPKKRPGYWQRRDHLNLLKLLSEGIDPKLPAPAAQVANPVSPGMFRRDMYKGKQAYAAYNEALARSQGREVGLFWNDVTGEYVVNVGDTGGVRSPPGGRSWRAVVHYHPDADTVRAFGLPAMVDFDHLDWIFTIGLDKKHRVFEFVEFNIPGVGRGRTEYGYDPAHPDNPLYVRIHKPDEPPQTLRFAKRKAFGSARSSLTFYAETSGTLYNDLLKEPRKLYKDWSLQVPKPTDAGDAQPNAAPESGEPKVVVDEAYLEDVRRATGAGNKTMAGTGRSAPPPTPLTSRPPPKPPSATHQRLLDRLRQGIDASLPEPSTEVANPLGKGVFRRFIFDGDAAYEAYNEALARAGRREVGVFYREATGEYAVCVGDEGRVGSPAGLDWQSIVHYHHDAGTVLTLRMPAHADFETLMYRYFGTEARSFELVEFNVPGVGRVRTEYGFDPTVPDLPVYVRIYTPNAGAKTLRFKTPDHFWAYWNQNTFFAARGSALHTQLTENAKAAAHKIKPFGPGTRPGRARAAVGKRGWKNPKAKGAAPGDAQTAPATPTEVTRPPQQTVKTQSAAYPNAEAAKQTPHVSSETGSGAQPAPGSVLESIHKSAMQIDVPLGVRGQALHTVHASAWDFLLSAQLDTERNRERMKALAELARLEPQIEAHRRAGKSVTVTVVAEVPEQPDVAAKVTGGGNQGQVVYFKTMYISAVLDITSRAWQAPNPRAGKRHFIQAAGGSRNPLAYEPDALTLPQQIEVQTGENYPIQEQRPREGFRYESRDMHLLPYPPETVPGKPAARGLQGTYHPVDIQVIHRGATQTVEDYGLTRGLIISAGRLASLDATMIDLNDNVVFMTQPSPHPDSSDRFRRTFEKRVPGGSRYAIRSTFSYQPTQDADVLIEDANSKDLDASGQVGPLDWRARLIWRKF